MAQRSVIVVGAGIAGLTAAYRLSRSGFKVTVLEASDRVGGRMSTDRRNGLLIDRGAQFLSSGYAVIGRLIAEIGLAEQLCRAAKWTGTVRNGRICCINADYPWMLATSGLLPFRDALRVASASIRLSRQTSGLLLSDYSQWHRFDIVDAAERLSATFGHEALECVFEPMLEGFYFQPPEQMSFAWPAAVWSFGLRRHRIMALANGIGSLPEALARTVDVRLNTPVQSLDVNGSGVDVGIPGEVLQTDHIVLATTAPAARQLYTPQLVVEQRLLGTGYSPSITIGLAVAGRASALKPVQKLYGLLIPRRERDVIASVAIETNKCRQYVPQGELLTVMLSGEASRKLMGADEDKLLHSVLPELRRYFPGIESRISFAHVSRWKEAEPFSPVGRSRDLKEYRQTWRSDMKVVLAGDYMGIPCTEGAAESGEWAASALTADGQPHAQTIQPSPEGYGRSECRHECRAI